jgi:hypothetical protein
MLLCIACNLTSFTLCLTGPVDYLFASRHKGLRFKSPGGYLCETKIFLLALSRYIGDPNAIDHHCSLVCGGLRPKLSLGPRANNVIIPLDLTQLFCPGFMLAAGPPSSFTTDGVGCWGGALWRACNLTSFTLCLTGPVDYLFASRHKALRFKSPGGVLCETGILLLALSRYTTDDLQRFLTVPYLLKERTIKKYHLRPALDFARQSLSIKEFQNIPCVHESQLLKHHECV